MINFRTSKSSKPNMSKMPMKPSAPPLESNDDGALLLPKYKWRLMARGGKACYVKLADHWLNQPVWS